MNRKVADWNDAVDDAYTHLNERSRQYGAQQMIALIDDLAMRGAATQTELIEAHGKEDFIATTLGHVTTAVHGPGNVPTVGGWYTSTTHPLIYQINPEFAAAWKAKRRLPRKS